MSTVSVTELVKYVDGLINLPPRQDYCVNGLQVEGAPSVSRIVSGVSVCQELIDAARERGAELLLVHHGLFWKGDEGRIVGMKRARLKKMLEAEMNLVAYHLPLDTHPELGNNALLMRALRAETVGPLPGEPGVLVGRFDTPLSFSEFSARVQHAVGNEVRAVEGNRAGVATVGVCTGGGQGLFEAAALQGIDAFVTGESAEKVFHMAREYGAHFFAAGHHATEVFGVRALGEHLAGKFGLAHDFVDIRNPL